jgi:hypothetical protein
MRLLRANVIGARVDGRIRGRIYLSLSDPAARSEDALATQGESIYFPKSTLSGPWGIFFVVICAMFAFVVYVRTRYWWVHDNPPFAVLSGIGLALFLLPLLALLSKLTGALADLSDRFTDR